MAYKLWLPGDPEPGTEEFERRRPPTPGSVPSAATKGSPRPTAHDLFMTKVAPAFRRVVERLEPLLADQWLGATQRIRQSSPDVLDAIDAAEERADEMARQFMAGQATEAQFLDAVSEYEAAWRVGAAVIADQSACPPDRSACAGCGRTDSVVLVHMDGGQTFCGRCLAGGGPERATS
jgi:hypothetical protein